MKNFKKHIIISALVISCALTACSKPSNPAATGTDEKKEDEAFNSSQSDFSETEETTVPASTDYAPIYETEDISDMNILFAPSDSAEINNDNPRIDYSREEAAELINKMPNLTASDKIHVYAPKSIDHVSTFYLSGTDPLPVEEGIENFKNTFSYLFPEHEFDEECFYYNGGSSDIEYETDEKGNITKISRFFNKIKDKYQQLVSGEEEMMLFIYNEDFSDKKDKVNLVARSPFGNDISIVNKGVANRIAQNNDYTKVDELFYASSYFRFVKSCDPDSEEKVKLLNGEISVKDAAAFYEDYINNIPCYINQFFTMNVNKVDIYNVNDDLNCLYFTTSAKYNSIPFDGAESFATGERTQRTPKYLGYGHMISTDDVDGFYGAFKLDTVVDETQYKEHVSLKRALEIVSEEMTGHIDFKVESVRFVYCFNDSISGYNFSEVRRPTFPAWKMELYNENDGLEYTCYINALSEDYKCYYLQKY